MFVSTFVTALPGWDDQAHEPLRPFVIINRNIPDMLLTRWPGLWVSDKAQGAFSVFVRSWSDLKGFDRS